MKVLVDREKLLKVLNRVQSVADKRSSMAILSTVLVEGTEGGLSLSATDLEIGFKGFVPADIEGSSAFCLPAKKFYEIVKSFPKETVVIEAEDSERVVVRDMDEEISYRLSVLPSEDFPSLPELEGEAALDVPGELFEEMIEKTIYAASTEEARYALSGIFVTQEEGRLRMVATDGHRLSLVEREVPGVEALELEEGVIVPRKAASEMKRISGDEIVVRIAVRENHFILSSSEGILMARLIEGQFPDYKAVIPKERGRVVLFDKTKLTEALKRVSLLSTEKYKTVRFEFSYGEVVLVGSGGELGEAKERLSVAYEGEPFSINFNAKYILDALQVMDSDEVEMDIGSERTPCKITGKKDEGFLSLVMPMAV